MGLSMFFAFIILASITIHALYLLHKHKGKHVSGASLPLPPGPVGLPLIENAVTFFGLLRHNPHRALARLAEVYGPIFSFRPGKTCTFVVLSSPALAREALAEKGVFLANRFVPDSVRALAYNAGSMAFLPSSNPLWKQHRVTTGVHLTSGKGLNMTRPIRDRHARQLVELLRACSGRPVKVGEVVFGAANNVISNILFSENVDMFIGASETSNITVEWAMAHLLHLPKKMEKLRSEISAVLGSKDFVEESDLDKLPYLHAVVKETLRLHPVVPVVTREVSADGVSLGGFPVPLFTCVLVNLWAIGRDPTAWHEPEEFKPERFLSADAEALHFRGSDFAYRPFGAGRRMCPGLDFAAKFVPLVLASILHRIDWKLPYGMTPDDVDLSDHCTLVLGLAKPLYAVPVYRT
ncbi:hypothetical protein QOZ80_6BG0490570 [Eleusine coracana subsp. coracana]|nr:hypothetical protein QOZ80_6BG0490570 [Eleusine coracana subsp. coracana]